MYLSKVHKFHKESCCLEQVYHFKYYFFRLSSIERIKIGYWDVRDPEFSRKNEFIKSDRLKTEMMYLILFYYIFPLIIHINNGNIWNIRKLKDY